MKRIKKRLRNLIKVRKVNYLTSKMVAKAFYKEYADHIESACKEPVLLTTILNKRSK